LLRETTCRRGVAAGSHKQARPTVYRTPVASRTFTLKLVVLKMGFLEEGDPLNWEVIFAANANESERGGENISSFGI
jgi:hypothetical protein